MEQTYLQLGLLTCLFLWTEGSAPDISAIRPSIDVALVKKESYIYELNFFCDFHPLLGTNYLYSIEWGITNGLSWTYAIKLFSPSVYLDFYEFREKTALTEQMLKEKDFYRPGITIACSVRAQDEINGIASAARMSPPKFIGIEVINSTVKISGTEKAKIFLRLSVPFGCPYWTPERCNIDLNVFIPQTFETCNIAKASLSNGDRIPCVVSIPNEKVGELIPFSISSASDSSSASFNLLIGIREDRFNPFFSNYMLDPIRIEFHTDLSSFERRDCSSDEGHIRTFDGLAYEHQFYGSFVFYRNIQFNTQVHLQSERCGERVFCHCGIAISVGRDVFIANNCGNNQNPKWHFEFRACDDRILKRSVKKISAIRYEVYLPTGTTVIINLRNSQLIVKVVPGLSDFKNTEGLCGSFDYDTSNDRQIRPGSSTSVPQLSWRVLLLEDLFDFRNIHGIQPWFDQKPLCGCDSSFNQPVYDHMTCDSERAQECSEYNLHPSLHDQCSLV